MTLDATWLHMAWLTVTVCLWCQLALAFVLVKPCSFMWFVDIVLLLESRMLENDFILSTQSKAFYCHFYFNNIKNIHI